MAEKHTPTPWKTDVQERKGQNLHIITSESIDGFDPLSGMNLVAAVSYGTNSRGNAELIVRAVNSHAALVEALKAMQSACDEWAAEFTQCKRAMDWGIVNDAYCKAEKALRLAKGE